MSLRGQFANWPWQSASPVPSAPCLKGAARRSRDWGILFLHFLQPIRRGRCPHRPERFFSHPGRAHGPCPTRCCVIGPGRTGSSAPTNRSVGATLTVARPPIPFFPLIPLFSQKNSGAYAPPLHTIFSLPHSTPFSSKYARVWRIFFCISSRKASRESNFTSPRSRLQNSSRMSCP